MSAKIKKCPTCKSRSVGAILCVRPSHKLGGSHGVDCVWCDDNWHKLRIEYKTMGKWKLWKYANDYQIARTLIESRANPVAECRVVPAGKGN